MYAEVDAQDLYEHLNHNLTVREEGDTIVLRCTECMVDIATVEKVEYRVEVRATFIGYITAHGFSADDVTEGLEAPYNVEDYDEFELESPEVYDAYEA